MSKPMHIYRCSTCTEVAATKEKLEGVVLHGKSPGESKRCGGVMVYDGTSPRQSDGRPEKA